MVHIRQLGDTTLEFIVSGKLWSNSMIMQDRGTNSLWSHFTGECWEGSLLDRGLEQIPSVQTTWSEWKREHPETKVLKKSEAVSSSHYASYFQDPDRIGILRTEYLEKRIPGKTLVHGIIHGPFTLAITDTKLKTGEPLATILGGDSLSVTHDPDGGIRAHVIKNGKPSTELPVYPNFWFSWSSFHPKSEVIE